jgi:hypothetical protein
MVRSEEETDSAALLSLGLDFWKAKALLCAVELGIFAQLSDRTLSADELVRDLGLHGRGATDLFDVLVALGILTRAEGRYSNSSAAEAYLVPDKPNYIGGALELANSRLYPVWGKLTEGLRSGLPQNEAQQESDYYGSLTRDRERLQLFLRAMTGLSMASSRAIARKFPWEKYATFVDVGGAQGELSIELASRHLHLRGATFDLPPVQPFFEERVAQFGLSQRLRYVAGDFFRDPLPSAEVLVMGHVLHNWNLEQKKLLIAKAYAALPVGGALVIYEALIDDDRSENAFGMLMSLNMLLVTAGGFVFTGAQCASWMNEVGFRDTRVEHLQGPDSMVIGLK